MYYDRDTKKNYIGLDPFDSHLLSGFENTPRISVFNFQNNNWGKIYASPKGLYNTRNKLN